MKKTMLIGAVLTVGAIGALLAPTAIADTTTTTSPTATTTTATSTTTAPPTTTTPAEDPLWIKVTPKSVHVGDTAYVDVRCWAPKLSSTPALDIASHGVVLSGDNDSNEVLRFDATVQNVPAGTYKVSVDCLDGPGMTHSGNATATFTVLPKTQVTKKPVGAPQTGGGFTATQLVG